MPNYADGVNPEILKWARESAGYSLDEIAKAFKKSVEAISQWEEGELVPTYNQLERLAYTFYKRPVALFFFPIPPQEPGPKESFRTLPEFEIENLHPDTRHAIREARAMQFVLGELTVGKNPSERQVFKDLKIQSSANVAHTAAQLRAYLGVSVSDQARWSNPTQALEKWRQLAQDAGIFIFKRSFKQRDVSGFCLVDPELPIIYLNNSTAKTRQIFSIFHEIAHILLDTSGVTKTNDSYIAMLSGQARSIEVFCNSFAAEFLVPSADFNHRLNLYENEPIDELTTSLAKTYNVSREVILRKLLDRNIVDKAYYESMAEKWLEEYQESRSSGGGGGDYYATQASYLGDRFMNLAFSRYYEGKANLQQLAGYLNIKAKSVDGLERHMLRRASTQ